MTDKEKMEKLRLDISAKTVLMKTLHTWLHQDRREFEELEQHKIDRIQELKSQVAQKKKELEDLEGENGEGDFLADDAFNNELAKQI